MRDGLGNPFSSSHRRHSEDGLKVPRSTRIKEELFDENTIEEGFYVDEEHLPFQNTGASRGGTIWDVYNNESRIVDRELIKDWTSSLNSLLLFVRSSLTTGWLH